MMLAEEGATAVNLALFDLDGTLPLDSDHAWGEFVVRLGWADGDEFPRRNDEFFAQYKAGTLDIHAYVAFATEPMRSHGGPEPPPRGARSFMPVVEPALRRRRWRWCASTSARRPRWPLVTATNEFVTAPIARLRHAS